MNLHSSSICAVGISCGPKRDRSLSFSTNILYNAKGTTIHDDSAIRMYCSAVKLDSCTHKISKNCHAVSIYDRRRVVGQDLRHEEHGCALFHRYSSKR